MIHQFFLSIQFNFTLFLRLTVIGSKRKSPKRRNFKFGASNGFDGVHIQSHFIRILQVKIPRFSNGKIIDFDIYDFLQGEKIKKYLHKSYRIVTSSLVTKTYDSNAIQS